ncbi:MAG: PAS-domain containing protein, partial [Planctomycetota bacterium]
MSERTDNKSWQYPLALFFVVLTGTALVQIGLGLVINNIVTEDTPAWVPTAIQIAALTLVLFPLAWVFALWPILAANHRIIRQYRELETKVEDRTQHLSQTRALLNKETAAKEQVERRLQDSKAQFQTLADYFPDPVFVLDQEDKTVPFRVLYVNGVVTKLQGMQTGELVGKSITGLFQMTEKSASGGDWLNRVFSGEVIGFEASIKHQNGSSIPVEVRAGIVPWMGRRAVLVIVRDLSERTHFEDSNRRSKAQLMDAIESIDAGLVMFGPDERLVVCNSKYKQLYAAGAHAMVPGTPKETVLREYCRNGGKPPDGLSVDDWIKQRLSAHRQPGHESIQRLGDRWIRVSDRRTSDGGVVSLRTDI